MNPNVYMALSDRRRKRHARTEFQCSKFLPVLFVIVILSILYFVYTCYHCLPLLQSGDQTASYRGRAHMVTFHLLTVMVLVNYVLAIVVDPGGVPDKEEWQWPPIEGAPQTTLSASSAKHQPPLSLVETFEYKSTGEKRHCKHCSKYKPDRSHHCRVCDSCVLRMDHHCPWIYNCVGRGNHKYFFLLLLYSTLSCHFISITMFESVLRDVVDDETAFHRMFFLLFGETLASFMGVLVTAFFCFHIFLVVRNLTTIEFCELYRKVPERQEQVHYDRGFFTNIKQALGPDPLLWLLPIVRNTDCRDVFPNANAYENDERTPLVVETENNQRSSKNKSPTQKRHEKQIQKKAIPVLDERLLDKCEVPEWTSAARDIEM